MRIKCETAADHAAAVEVQRRAFGDRAPVVAALVEDLRRDFPGGAGLSLVAEDAGGICGHVVLTPALLDAPRQLVDVFVLSPLAVVPEHQGEGIGAALVRHGLETLESRGIPLVFLEGAPGFYRRLGFERADRCGFRKPSLRIPDAAFQVARLAAYETWMTGTFVYPDAFWRNDAVGLRPRSTTS